MGLPIMYISLTFPYVFTHRSACTEQNLSQRFQPAMVFVNVTHIHHSGTAPYGTSRSHYYTKINTDKIMKNWSCTQHEGIRRSGAVVPNIFTSALDGGVLLALRSGRLTPG